MSNPLLKADPLTRRALMAGAARSLLGVSLFSLGGASAAAAEGDRDERRLIYLFMVGAMSHLDTFDPKPGSEVQGQTGVIQTSIPGVRFGESLPKLAGMADKLAVVRSLHSETGAHAPGQYVMRTSYSQIASTRHPGWGAWTHRLAGRMHRDLPAAVQIGGGEGPGYLGAKFAPVPIGDPLKGLENTKSPAYLSDDQFDRRMRLAGKFDASFRALARHKQVAGYDDLYREAIALLRSEDLAAFDITQEAQATRDAYGEGKFGQGCLLARRLIQHGVRCVEVALPSWDHHNNIFEEIPEKAGALDTAVAALLNDLESQGLLENTVVAIGTEFGRKPNINVNAGRDHHPAAFSGVLAGGPIKTGQVYGATDSDGFHVDSDHATPQDFNATIAKALGLPHDEEIFSPDGRPFTIANGGEPIDALV